MAIIMQNVFSPEYGYSTDKLINSFLATGALAFGKLVAPADTTGILALANDWPAYFLMEEVTADGPSMFEIEMGDYQFEKKATANTAVTVWTPAYGDIVRTIHVAQGGGGGAAVAIGQLVNISNGVFVTVGGNAGTKGRVIGSFTNSLGTVLWRVQVYPAK